MNLGNLAGPLGQRPWRHRREGNNQHGLVEMQQGKRVQLFVLEGRKCIAKAFDELGIKYWPSQANFFIIDPPLPEMEFTDKMMEQGIMVRPVSQFGAPGKVRITIGDTEANEALIRAFHRILP